MSRLMPTIDFSKSGLDLVLEAAEMQCSLCLSELEAGLRDALVRARQALVAPPSRPHRLDPGSSGSSSGDPDLNELNHTLLTSICDGIRNQMSSLQLFIDPELTFAVKTYFRSKFSRFYVREGVLIAFFRRLVAAAGELCGEGGGGDGSSSSGLGAQSQSQPALLLLLSRTCLDLPGGGSTRQLVSSVDEQFFIDQSSSSSDRNLTPVPRIDAELREASQRLLDQYVKAQGGVLSQMLRKSVEARDWLNTVEPRAARAVMKRVVEEVTAMDRQVGRLYEEGARKARSSDSSRRANPSRTAGVVAGGSSSGRHHRSSAWSVANSQHLDTSLASNIQKMFSERIEIFAKVEASRVSVLTGVVKIALKTLLECVRMRTFSRYGFQQIQVISKQIRISTTLDFPK